MHELWFTHLASHKYLYTLQAKNVEYLESIMETPVYYISICWKWLGANHKQVSWLLCNCHVWYYGREMQFTMFEIKNTQ